MFRIKNTPPQNALYVVGNTSSHDIIYALAIKISEAQNTFERKEYERQLRAHLANNNYIDAYLDEKHFTVAGRLAKNGFKEAACMLVDRFGASLGPVIYMFACEGELAKVEDELLNADINFKYEYAIDAITGVLENKNREQFFYLLDFIRLFILNEMDYADLVCSIFVAAGNDRQLDLMAELATIYQFADEILIEGYAAADRLDLSPYDADWVDPSHDVAVLSGYIKAGLDEKTIALVSLKKELVIKAVDFAAHARRKALVEWLMIYNPYNEYHGSLMCTAAAGFASQGMTDEVAKYISQGASAQRVLGEYILHEHYALVGSVLMTLCHNESDELSKWIYIDYAKRIFDHYSYLSLLKLFTYIVEEEVCSHLYIHMSEWVLGEKKDKIKIIYAQSKLIRYAMSECDMSFTDALKAINAKRMAHETIYRLAVDIVEAESSNIRKRKEVELKLFLSADHVVGERTSGAGDDTALTLLMKDGHERAAEMLVNKYGAMMADLIHAYARKGRKVKVISLLAKYGCKYSYSCAVDGAILSNDDDLFVSITALAKQAYPDEDDFKFIITDAVIQLAVKSKLDLLERFKHYLNRENWIFIYAKKGEIDSVNYFLGVAPAKHNLVAAIEGYIQSKQYYEIRKLIVNYDFLIDDALRAAICEFDVAFSNELLEAGASKNIAVKLYAELGNIAEVKKILAAGAEQKYAIKGYINGEHYSLVERYLGPTRYNLGHPIWEIQGILKQLEPCEVSRLLIFIKDDAARSYIVRAVNRDDWTSADKVAGKIQKFMTLHNIGVEEAKILVPEAVIPQLHEAQDAKRKAEQANTLLIENSIHVSDLLNQQVSFVIAVALVQSPGLGAWLATSRDPTYGHSCLHDDLLAIVASFVGSMPTHEAHSLRKRIEPVYQGVLFPRAVTQAATDNPKYSHRRTSVRETRLVRLLQTTVSKRADIKRPVIKPSESTPPRKRR